MRYTGPKFKLCRREGVNLFGSDKYDVRKRRKLPGQHGANMPRLSEFAKMLRNKQTLKRTYCLTEKQFKKLIMVAAQKFSKNNGVDHDKAALMFLERRLDSIIYKSGLANSMMQARQMVVHAHFNLNGVKHNVPSYLVKAGDVLEIRSKVKDSPLYAASPVVSGNYNAPSWLKVDASKLKVEVLDLPNSEDVSVPADVLKVIEFYARA